MAIITKENGIKIRKMVMGYIFIKKQRKFTKEIGKMEIERVTDNIYILMEIFTWEFSKRI